MKTLLLTLAIAGLAIGAPRDNYRNGPNRSNYRVGVSVYRIPQPDVVIVRDYYRGNRLPRGLQKKLARGGSLPPGWQRRFQPVPIYVERRLAPLPYGYRRGLYNGAYVVYDSRRGVLVDFFASF
jgi:hypothetical protein